MALEEVSGRLDISAEFAGLIYSADTDIDFSVLYANDPVDKSTTGLGLRVHFDSSSVSFSSFENLFQTSLQPFGQVVENDTQDFDQDASTDKFIAFNWADFSQAWPGDVAFPLTLVDMAFDGVAGGGDTRINFSASSVPVDLEFSPTSLRLFADRWPLPDDVSIRENSANGTVVDDLAPDVLDPADPGVFTLIDDAGGRFVLDGFQLKVADGSLIDFEAAQSHEVEIRIANNFGATIEKTLNVAVEDVAEQIVRPVKAGAITAGGDRFVVSANYSTADPVDPTLSGLGLRIHFNSAALQFDGFENLFQTGLQPFGRVVENDTGNFDGDATTDRFVSVSWADLSQNWPGVDEQVLYDAAFTSIAGADTSVNFSASSTADGRIFISDSFVTLTDRWPVPGTVQVDEAVDNGTLVADFTPNAVDQQDPGTMRLADDAGGRFVMDGFQLKVANGQLLDFETTETHTIGLLIESNTGAEVTRQIQVQLNDVVEADLDLDGNGRADALTDGLIALGDMFGAPTSQLASFAASGSPGRDATVLGQRLGEATTTFFDVDGNGRTDALTDGLMILGFLFGAPNSQLATFAASDATRTSAEDIGTFLNNFLPATELPG